VQSGNIIFKAESGSDPSQLARQIRNKLDHKYGFDVPTIVLDPGDLKHLIDQNPFRDPQTLKERLYVTFLFDQPDADRIRALEKQKHGNEHFVVYGKFIFLYYPKGYGVAKMDNNAFEKVLKVEATTRNWKTINKIYEMTIT
jgi:uncharacterized protein (DUF1697 family)